ncbi:molybdenum cofactor biosynthesis protein MoaE [Ornithinibacillus sp. BX22]|uniref:Molybdopterin synthase catalytic subunit n=2 Tax=Ornithinibacillus TaxID=484508 RepID=A0A923L6R9_9BACI|nr:MULTISPECIES: molybdenum cofactor biosynthesis protein MoaE [Ornithinibacillus]MBC5637405.1 molybdenum cofactor biosynthesis protein MoaE [Ornithinibacillus hominis]MBS3680287.1 molybdenum cofactor biosynthesis protein MoaE [Ornithinibacillus massiliensis]
MKEDMYEILEEPIQVEKIIEKVTRRKAGAITTFLGTVREWTDGRRTIFLEYQAYKTMAVKKLAQIGKEIQERWPDTEVAITHRIGKLTISEIAVVIAVSSPHRKAAYEANEFAIERIKQIVPIWKKEHWDDGETWIGDQLEQNAYPNGEPS